MAMSCMHSISKNIYILLFKISSLARSERTTCASAYERYINITQFLHLANIDFRKHTFKQLSLTCCEKKGKQRGKEERRKRKRVAED